MIHKKRVQVAQNNVLRMATNASSRTRLIHLHESTNTLTFENISTTNR